MSTNYIKASPTKKNGCWTKAKTWTEKEIQCARMIRNDRDERETFFDLLLMFISPPSERMSRSKADTKLTAFSEEMKTLICFCSASENKAPQQTGGYGKDGLNAIVHIEAIVLPDSHKS